MLRWRIARGQTPREAIYVVRLGGAEDEDGGVLLGVVLDGLMERSDLLCLDERTMCGGKGPR